eukprot:scaffold11948_cov107-Isochrysis_galbana.AAC.3
MQHTEMSIWTAGVSCDGPQRRLTHGGKLGRATGGGDDGADVIATTIADRSPGEPAVLAAASQMDGKTGAYAPSTPRTSCAVCFGGILPEPESRSSAAALAGLSFANLVLGALALHASLPLTHHSPLSCCVCLCETESVCVGDYIVMRC